MNSGRIARLERSTTDIEDRTRALARLEQINVFRPHQLAEHDGKNGRLAFSLITQNRIASAASQQLPCGPEFSGLQRRT